jgi:hypothetical protein
MTDANGPVATLGYRGTAFFRTYSEQRRRRNVLDNRVEKYYSFTA